jgi:serine/threonine-protein kinase
MGSIRETLGHYEVLRAIGAGGMGEVFVARDPKLGRKVAIKLLPPQLASETDTLNRFAQEARAASALNHPNIVTIHEVGADAGAPFIVMEYIDGRDLRTLIAEAPLPVRQVLDIGVQIADGLAAAHERGIVHRDLKPENIMITRDGYVKILDFGLAKVVGPTPEGEHTLQRDLPETMPGTILGTVGYMSPEQATEKRVDFRSDLFAFGAILHELVTRHAAFDRENAIDTLSAILYDDPEPVTRSNVRVPVQLADIISRLLAKSPDDRYFSTYHLARELRLLRDRVAAEKGEEHQSLSEPREPAGIIIGVVALIILLGGIFIYSRKRPDPAYSRESPDPAPAATAASAPAPTKKYLAVLRFKNLSGDPNGQFLVDGFAETLTARLAHFPAVQVIRPTTPDQGTGDPRKLAKELGANLVLTGSMMRDGDRIRVTYTVLDPKSGREWHDLVEGSVSNLFGVQDNVAASVARNLDLGTLSVHVASLDPTVSQQRYLQAVGHLHRYDDEASVDYAIRLLESLGDSPSVQATLARAYLYKYQDTHEPRYATSAGRAAESALASDPQSLAVNVTLGELRRQTGRHKEAVEAFLRVLSLQPNNVDAVLGLAEAYNAARDFRSAEVQYQRAIALQPNSWSGYNKLGAFYFARSRFIDALAQFQTVVRLVPDNERGNANLGATYQRVGRYDDALRILQESIRRKPSGQAYSNLGNCYYHLADYPRAATAFEEAVKRVPRESLYWRNLGEAYRWIPGAEAKAHRAFERTVELCDDALRVDATDARIHISRAVSLARIGRAREARAAIIHAIELEPQHSAGVYQAAVIANLAGDADGAVARLQQAVCMDYRPDDILRDPEFANLRKSGRLQVIAALRCTPH